jgi:Tol biopolymer transport system component
MNMDGSDVQAISPEGATASSQTWYVDDSIIAYQSDADGDFDIYVYEFASQKTRLVTDNTIGDYAPTWFCSAPIVIFTSDIIDNDPNIYNTPALPIEANAILVEEEASQMTENPTNDIYPENSPSEENASLGDSLPPKFTAP